MDNFHAILITDAHGGLSSDSTINKRLPQRASTMKTLTFERALDTTARTALRMFEIPPTVHLLRISAIIVRILLGNGSGIVVVWGPFHGFNCLSSVHNIGGNEFEIGQGCHIAITK